MVFVHVQKTGGRTVNQALWDNVRGVEIICSRHTPLARAIEKHPELGGYFAFGFVRNPWDRLVSWYSMIAKAHTTPLHDDHLTRNRFWQAVRADLPDFETFIRKGVGDPDFRPKRFQRLRRPQAAFFDDATGNRARGFIGRTERLEADLTIGLDMLGISVPAVPRVNVGDHRHYRDYYNAGLRDIVASVYRRDIEEFGYEF
jgi:hypothetical protein